MLERCIHPTTLLVVGLPLIGRLAQLCRRNKSQERQRSWTCAQGSTSTVQGPNKVLLWSTNACSRNMSTACCRKTYCVAVYHLSWFTLIAALLDFVTESKRRLTGWLLIGSFDNVNGPFHMHKEKVIKQPLFAGLEYCQTITLCREWRIALGVHVIESNNILQRCTQGLIWLFHHLPQQINIGGIGLMVTFNSQI